MSRPGSDSVGTEYPYILPYIWGKTLKVLKPHPETQPVLHEIATKPNWYMAMSPSVSTKTHTTTTKNTPQASKWSKKDWMGDEGGEEGEGKLPKEVKFELDFDGLVGIC